ncbi:polymorphic toxin-type HINT domain-containing protein [Dactylosporangium sp. NPDC048998]|uniref:polymorphic toxin-type HINT domain-containing protein n=1 Tax=Dactylosporangium sp. NPDC048998 TaxID=3363976 RepID=UPI003719E3D4
MTMAFGGRSGRLVKDDANGKWHLESDDGSRIELLTDNSKGNGDWLGRYWKLTTLDGTQYFFGMNKRYAGDTQPTNSAQNVLVYSNHAGEPCKNDVHDWWSGCDMTYRWNLDYVVDPRGNTMTYFYTKYQGKYGNWNGTDTHVYDIAVTLDHIDYGTRAGGEASSTAPMQVLFRSLGRCLTEPCMDHAENWPDTPWDQFCALDRTSCTQTAPTFWTPYRLDNVTTRVWSPSTSSYQNADVWSLQHAFPSSGETNVPPSLWFDFLTHTGWDGGNSQAMPRTHFGGDRYPNLVASAGPYYQHFRLTYIDTGTGRTTTAAYSAPECTVSNVNGVPWDQFPLRCYPQWNGVGWNYYQKYVVTKVTDIDALTSAPNIETRYTYSTAGSSTNTLWHFGTDEATVSVHRSWTDFAGYSTVTTTRGPVGGQQSITKKLYYRGLDGDLTGSGTRQATITDSVNPAVTDSDGLRGTVREEQSLDGTAVLAKTIHQPWQSVTGTRTATWTQGTITSKYTREAQTDTGAWLAAGSSWRWARATQTYNSYGLNDTSKNWGATTTTTDDTCTTYTYAPPDTTKWMIDYPVQALTTNCAASPSGADYLSGSRTFYDNLGFNVTPTKGLATKSMKLGSVTSGTTLNWVQDGRAGYDPVYGRVTDTYDALDRQSTIAYSPANFAVTQTTATNPQGHISTTTYNPLRGNATSVTDPNSKTTTAQYDPLGRLTKVFKPHTATVSYTASTATQTFTDIISTGTAVALTGDDNQTQISLPFAFTFYGQTYSSAWLSTNGLLSFAGQGDDTNPQPLPNPDPPNAAIYPFWDDLLLDAGSAVATKITGTAPNRQFTIEWSKALLYGRSTHVTFTVTLNENGVIVFNYTDINPNGHDQGSAATVGIENATGSAATQYAYHQTLLADNKAITFTPSTGAAVTVPDIEYAYILRSTGGPNVVTTKVLGPAGNQITSYELYDGLMRLRQTQTPSLSAQNGRVIADVQYDNRGLAAKQATFWNSAAPADTIAGFTDTDIDLRSVTVYDNLERPIRAEQWSKTSKLWQTQTQYDGDRTTVIPPDGGAAVSTFDVFSKTITLDRYPTSSPTGTKESTSYTYDRLRQLTKVTDAAGNQTDYTYDLLGRRVSLTDPDAGTSSFVYDAAGQLTSTTDGRGQTISHEYDNLGRETARWAGNIGTGTKLATFTYDSLTKGLPTSSTRWVGADQYILSVDGYNDQYQPTGQTWTIPMIQGALAGTYQIGYTYDLVGNLATISYPNGAGLNAETVTHSYTTLGAPRSTLGATSYVTSTSYGGLGQLTQRINGSNGAASQLTRTYTYDPATMRLASVKSQLPDQAVPGQFTTIANDSYAYTPTGDITKITDLTDNQSQCYRYDGQHRLTEAWTAVDACAANPTTGAIAGSGKYPYWDSYQFDTAGRRTTDTHRTSSTNATTHTFHYPAAGAARVHAATSVDYTGAISRTDSMTYDNVGNTQQRTINGVVTDFTFNPENQFAAATVHATGGDQQTTHLYDATGSLLIRKDPTGATLYAAGQEYKTTGTTVTATRYYTHGGHTVAVRNSSGSYRLATDHQASANLTVNVTTAAVQRRWYTPYGDDRATQGGWPTDRGFLNKQTNASTGLLDVGAREYDPKLGTFISPDLVIAPGDPSTFNAYAYAGHSPITTSDPSGLMRDSDGGEAWIPQQQTECVGSCRADKLSKCHYQSASCTEYTPNRGGWSQSQQILKNGTVLTMEDGRKYINDVDVTGALTVYGAPSYSNLATAFDNYVGDHPPQNGDSIYDVDNTNRALYLAWTRGYADNPKSDDNLFRVELFGATPEGGWVLEHVILANGGGMGPAEVPVFLRGGGAARVRACGNSFSPDTEVLLADGSTKAIADVEEGDLVLASDPETNATASHVVTTLHVNLDIDLTVLTVLDESTGQISVLRTTEGHPFWSSTRRSWIFAGQLEPGEQLRSTGGQDGRVLFRENYVGSQWMYNLTVDALHTYYVMAGATPVLVHNDPAPPPPMVQNAIDAYNNGQLTQRMTGPKDAQVLDFFRGDTGPIGARRFWKGAKIYEMPGGGNDWRLLVKSDGTIGWVGPTGGVRGAGHNYDRIFTYMSPC